MIEDLRPGYWTHYRETFMRKEGVTETVTISRAVRESSAQSAGVEEEVVCESTVPGMSRYRYMRLHWYAAPIPGSAAKVNVEEKRTITEAEYSAFRDDRADEPQWYRLVCSCGWSSLSLSRWKDGSADWVHPECFGVTQALRIEPPDGASGRSI